MFGLFGKSPSTPLPEHPVATQFNGFSARMHAVTYDDYLLIQKSGELPPQTIAHLESKPELSSGGIKQGDLIIHPQQGIGHLVWFDPAHPNDPEHGASLKVSFNKNAYDPAKNTLATFDVQELMFGAKSAGGVFIVKLPCCLDTGSRVVMAAYRSQSDGALYGAARMTKAVDLNARALKGLEGIILSDRKDAMQRAANFVANCRPV